MDIEGLAKMPGCIAPNAGNHCFKIRKYYSMEAITEHLLNRIGEVFGFNMARSGFAWFGGQVDGLSLL